MPNPQLTQTKTKTKTRVGVALAFLALAALAAIGANQYTKQRQTQTQLFGTRPVGTATPTFCLTETTAAPSKSSVALSTEFFGIQPAQAAEGGLVVEAIRYGSGRHVDADIFIYRGTELVREIPAPGGEGRASLEEGIYRGRVVSWEGNLVGERERLEVVAGHESRFGILVEPGPTPTATATVPIPEPLRAELPGQRDCGSGTVRVIVGNICDRDNRILPNASGIINVSQRNQAVCHTNAVNGAFEIYDRPNGIYTLRFQNPGLGVFEKEVTLDLEPKRVNFEIRN